MAAMLRISAASGVSSDYLIHGVGPMKRAESAGTDAGRDAAVSMARAVVDVWFRATDALLAAAPFVDADTLPEVGEFERAVVELRAVLDSRKEHRSQDAGDAG